MGLLLDTCVFLWMLGLPEQLPQAVRNRLQDAGTDCAVSTATLWECLIKHGKGRIGFATGGKPVLDFLLRQCDRHALDVLPVEATALGPLERLPPLHSDPFDRLLICQAIEQGLTLVTPDRQIRQYPIKTLWD